MNRMKGLVVLGALVVAANAWAQTDQPASNPASQPANSDAIVKMRMDIAAANKKYNQKVAAAKKVFDQKKAEAAKERDAAVAAARSGSGG